MIKIDKDKNITVSKGDVLDIQFKVNGITLENSSRIFFSVKNKLKDEKSLISVEALIDLSLNSFRILLPTSIMKKLEIGTYCYDIVYVNKQGNMRTFVAPRLLIIREVVHDGLFDD